MASLFQINAHCPLHFPEAPRLSCRGRERGTEHHRLVKVRYACPKQRCRYYEVHGKQHPHEEPKLVFQSQQVHTRAARPLLQKAGW